MQKLKNKVAVITGGNSGIGKATAAMFAREGAQVVITARRQDVLENAVQEIGHGALGIQGDVADLEHHAAVASKVRELFGAVDIYIANAGIINLTTSDKVTPDEYDNHFAVNTRGVFFGVQEILPVMRDGGRIANEVRYPKGHDKSPMSAAEVEEKFSALFARYGSAAQGSRVIEVVQRLESVADVRELFEAFEKAGSDPEKAGV